MISDLSFFSSSQHNLIKMIDKNFNDKFNVKEKQRLKGGRTFVWDD